MFTRQIWPLAGICLASYALHAQQRTDKDSTTVFTLGQVTVNGYTKTDNTVKTGATTLQRMGKTDVAQALNTLPGINLSAVGPRNESMVYVRGFDLRQVPLLIDGVPVYVPYDGYVDLARFTTFDISEIQVSSSYTTVLYGPNALGGAINIITRKPVKPFEFNGATGWLSGGYRSNINVGANLGRFYLQAGASKLQRDAFPLSHQFKPAKTEAGGSRDNAYATDEKFNVKVAFTPNTRSEYALNFIYQHGTKGTPVYAGSDTLNSLYKSPRYWQWPAWDKRSLYFISNTRIDSSQYVKTRVYYDQFINQLNSYDDATYTTMKRPYAFASFYNDYTLGAIVEYGKRLSRKDNLQTTVQYKADVHREHNQGEPVRNMSDGTFTLGAENSLQLASALHLLTGASYNNRSSLRAENYNGTTKTVSDFPSNNNNAFNLQGSLAYHLNATQDLRLSAAHKTRFATTKDRYSYRMGTAIPNPDLKAEQAMHYNLDYAWHWQNKLHVSAGLFYSRISNTILSVSNVAQDTTTHTYLSQLQNAGRADYKGADLDIRYQLSPSLSANANYSYIERKNISNPSLHFTDVPRHKVFAQLQYQYRNVCYVQANLEYNSGRYSTTYGARAGDFAVFNTSAGVHVWKWFSIEAGINNLADRNYALVEGYPEPGRNYFVNLSYRL